MVSCGEDEPVNPTPQPDPDPIVDPQPEPEPTPDPEPEPEPEITYYSVTEAYQKALEFGEGGSQERQYVHGFVKNISNGSYGEMYITDGTTDLYVYGVYSSDGVLRYNELQDKPYSCDEVYLYGILKTYKGTPELGASWLQKFVSHQEDVDLSGYEFKPIINARNMDEGSKVIIEGVVAKITLANGKVPNGFYVVDNTSSIYVYSTELSARVSVGQKVKIAGTKTSYILESEKENAEKYGYQGSLQLTDPIFISASQELYEFDKEWELSYSIREIVNYPLHDNITNKIFKTVSYVKKVPGNGFVNYYFYDLDGKTGSYVYTLCNGSDYSYLDEFDGKICDVYLTPINCKATASGVYYRFIPIEVSAIDNFTLTDEQIRKFAIEYYAVDQFKPIFESDPMMELVVSVSNDLIPFENVTFRYETTSENVHIVDEDGKTIMHIDPAYETNTIDIYASYNGVETKYSDLFIIDYVEIPEHTSISEVIEAADGTEVTVRGIVMSGLVNQFGFYLNDGTGVIAVRTDFITIKDIALGNEVIMVGTKTHITKDKTKHIGQICIDNASLIVNLYGDNQYDDKTFITDKSFDDILGIVPNVLDDNTTEVYVVNCYITKTVGSYSTNYYLSDGKGNTIYLYAGNGSQYAPYDCFVDQGEVTVTFMLINWNSKSPYRACIITATNGTQTVLNDYNFR